MKNSIIDLIFKRYKYTIAGILIAIQTSIITYYTEYEVSLVYLAGGIAALLNEIVGSNEYESITITLTGILLLSVVIKCSKNLLKTNSLFKLLANYLGVILTAFPIVVLTLWYSFSLHLPTQYSAYLIGIYLIIIGLYRDKSLSATNN